MYSIVMCTSPIDEAPELASRVVVEKLVACVNICEVKSFFWWEGEVRNEGESLLIMKTRTDRIGELKERIQQIHSYEVPEVIAIPIVDGLRGYLSWIGESVE
ncbi:MAG: divalent-cation tolerance protein CutA [Dehalococcoidia bacterium]